MRIKSSEQMKANILFFSLLLFGVFSFNTSAAEDEIRTVSAFSEIGLSISAQLHLEQGSTQSVRIVAQSSTLKEIITEVKNNKLNIRFPSGSFFKKKKDWGKIEIFITVPDINALSITGSGNIMAKELEARILALAVSGSGNIKIDDLDSEKLKASISGSGNIAIGEGDVAQELSVSISGSGNFSGKQFEAEKVNVRTSGSGNCSVTSNGSIKASIAGSGSIYYAGNPSIDASIAGSGKVKKM